MGYTASCVLWFGFMVSHVEGCIHSEQGCKLVPLPWQSRTTGSKAGKGLCGLDSSLPAPTEQCSCFDSSLPAPASCFQLNDATDFALQMISSACQILCLSVAGQCSFQVSWLGFLARQVQELHSIVYKATAPLSEQSGGTDSKPGKAL